LARETSFITTTTALLAAVDTHEDDLRTGVSWEVRRGVQEAVCWLRLYVEVPVWSASLPEAHLRGVDVLVTWDYFRNPVACDEEEKGVQHVRGAKGIFRNTGRRAGSVARPNPCLVADLVVAEGINVHSVELRNHIAVCSHFLA